MYETQESITTNTLSLVLGFMNQEWLRKTKFQLKGNKLVRFTGY